MKANVRFPSYLLQKPAGPFFLRIKIPKAFRLRTPGVPAEFRLSLKTDSLSVARQRALNFVPMVKRLFNQADNNRVMLNIDQIKKHIRAWIQDQLEYDEELRVYGVNKGGPDGDADEHELYLLDQIQGEYKNMLVNQW